MNNRKNILSPRQVQKFRDRMLAAAIAQAALAPTVQAANILVTSPRVLHFVFGPRSFFNSAKWPKPSDGGCPEL